jgi:hypothetical protein
MPLRAGAAFVVAASATSIVALTDGDRTRAATASASQPSRAVDCSDRAEGNAPIQRPKGRGNLVAGPIAFIGLRRAARAPARDFTREPRGYLGWKSGVVLRANAEVTVSFAGSKPRVLRLDYPGGRGKPVKAVTFTACPEDEQAFSYDGVVGERTAFSGGFLVAERRCVRLRISVAGDPQPIIRRISFGAGRCKQPETDPHAAEYSAAR